ncbi:hypothetical protein C8J57DRAFT_1567192 [Mycena rebaudengoi]|nr:hypothetical protein C8J57DRAFT_1567192 [Mycena rebaudengoi]
MTCPPRPAAPPQEAQPQWSPLHQPTQFFRQDAAAGKPQWLHTVTPLAADKNATLPPLPLRPRVLPNTGAASSLPRGFERTVPTRRTPAATQRHWAPIPKQAPEPQLSPPSPIPPGPKCKRRRIDDGYDQLVLRMLRMGGRRCVRTFTSTLTGRRRPAARDAIAGERYSRQQFTVSGAAGTGVAAIGSDTLGVDTAAIRVATVLAA